MNIESVSYKFHPNFQNNVRTIDINKTLENLQVKALGWKEKVKSYNNA